MKSYEEYLNEAKDSSSKPKAMDAMVEAIRKVFDNYDMNTRQSIWKELTSAKGKDLVNKLIRNPKTYLSNSEFIKLLSDKRN